MTDRGIKPLSILHGFADTHTDHNLFQLRQRQHVLSTEFLLETWNDLCVIFFEQTRHCQNLNLYAQVLYTN